MPYGYFSPQKVFSVSFLKLPPPPPLRGYLMCKGIGVALNCKSAPFYTNETFTIDLLKLFICVEMSMLENSFCYFGFRFNAFCMVVKKPIQRFLSVLRFRIRSDPDLFGRIRILALLNDSISTFFVCTKAINTLEISVA
jgi:hypothetical protein